MQVGALQHWNREGKFENTMRGLGRQILFSILGSATFCWSGLELGSLLPATSFKFHPPHKRDRTAYTYFPADTQPLGSKNKCRQIHQGGLLSVVL